MERETGKEEGFPHSLHPSLCAQLQREGCSFGELRDHPAAAATNLWGRAQLHLRPTAAAPRWGRAPVRPRPAAPRRAPLHSHPASATPRFGRARVRSWESGFAS